MSELRPGTVIAGKFRIERRIGAGAMALVYEALHLELRQSVALKFLNDVYRADTDASARFVREARAQFSLKSEHVGRVFDVGRTETGQPFIVMELLAGQSLKEVLDARERLPVREAVDIMIQVCEGVGEAHALGIVHRDLKPGNIFVTPQSDGGRLVKVLDFGLAKARDHASEGSLTAADMLIGTPRYMAPEQFANAGLAGAHTDVWALGIVLYRMVTGVLPFDGPHPLAIAHKIRKDDAVPPTKHNPELLPALSSLILRCLNRDPAARFKTATALGQALALIAPTLGSGPAAETSMESTLEMSRGEVTPKVAPRRTPRPAAGVPAAAGSAQKLPRPNLPQARPPPTRDSKTERISQPDTLPPPAAQGGQVGGKSTPSDAEELSLSGDDATEIAVSAPVSLGPDGSSETRVAAARPSDPGVAPISAEGEWRPQSADARGGGPLLPLPALDESDLATRRRPAMFSSPDNRVAPAPYDSPAPSPYDPSYENAPPVFAPAPAPSSPQMGTVRSAGAGAPLLNAPPLDARAADGPLAPLTVLKQKLAAAGPAGYFALALAVSGTLMFLVVFLVDGSNPGPVRHVPTAKPSAKPAPPPVVQGGRIFTTLDETAPAVDAGAPTSPRR